MRPCAGLPTVARRKIGDGVAEPGQIEAGVEQGAGGSDLFERLVAAVGEIDKFEHADDARARVEQRRDGVDALFAGPCVADGLGDGVVVGAD